MTSIFHHSFLVPFASDLSVLLATKTPVLVVRRTKLPFPPTSSQNLRSPKLSPLPLSEFAVVRVRVRSEAYFSCRPLHSPAFLVVLSEAELSVTHPSCLFASERIRSHPKHPKRIRSFSPLISLSDSLFSHLVHSGVARTCPAGGGPSHYHRLSTCLHVDSPLHSGAHREGLKFKTPPPFHRHLIILFRH